MDFNFYPVETNDGSVGLYSETVEDIYHSSYGAYNEAVEKFIIPSGFFEFVSNNSEVKLLDICYGIGYNTKAAIKNALDVNPNINISVTCLEIDPEVLAFSSMVEQKNFDEKTLDILSAKILNLEKIEDSFFRIIFNEKFHPFFDQKTIDFSNELRKQGIDDIENPVLKTKLHNIYYEYISGRNKKMQEPSLKSSNISFLPILNDARRSVKAMEGTFDFIFLDAFTPVKLPNLWSVEFFTELSRILAPSGNITTYSNSAAVRSGMIEAGLFVGKTSQGTIAYNDESLVKTHLDEKSLGLLQTRAGIPFRDQNLKSSVDAILHVRQEEVESSDRISSSRFLKDFQNKS